MNWDLLTFSLPIALPLAVSTVSLMLRFKRENKDADTKRRIYTIQKIEDYDDELRLLNTSDEPDRDVRYLVCLERLATYRRKGIMEADLFDDAFEHLFRNDHKAWESVIMERRKAAGDDKMYGNILWYKKTKEIT